MSRSSKRLILFSISYLISAGLGTALAVLQDLPAEFGGLLHGQNVLGDFFTGLGTALSPPLIMLILQVFFMIFLSRYGALRRVGAGGLLVLGVLYFFGQLGEPLTWRQFTLGGFLLAQGLLIAANLVLPVLMAYFGLRVLRRAIHPEGVAPF